jgi:hypothetical protein
MIYGNKFMTCKKAYIFITSQVLCGSEVPYAGMLERVEQELVLKV